jgi:hypothetical protein
VTSVEVDYRGNIFWAVSKDGKDDGVIFKGSADEPNSSTTQVVSKKLDSTQSLCYKLEFLFFSGVDTTLDDSD